METQNLTAVCVVLIDFVFLEMRMEMRMGCVLRMRIITMVSPLFSSLVSSLLFSYSSPSCLTSRREGLYDGRGEEEGSSGLL